MSTTNVIAEIIATGFFSLIWLLLLIFKITGVQIPIVFQDLVIYKDWGSILLVVFFITCYQLGWLINSLSHTIIDATLGSKYRGKLFKQNNLDYEKARESFYQYASSDLRNDLGLDRTIIRLSRGGIVNFTLIFLVLLFYGTNCIELAFISLILAIGSFFQWRQRFKRYYKRIIISHDIINPRISNGE